MRKMLALIGAAILTLLLNGCSKDTASTPAKANINNTSSSFQDKLSDTFMPAIKVKIVTDPKTGVEYIELIEDNGISITPRLGKDGKPYIDQKWKSH